MASLSLGDWKTLEKLSLVGRGDGQQADIPWACLSWCGTATSGAWPRMTRASKFPAGCSQGWTSIQWLRVGWKKGVPPSPRVLTKSLPLAQVMQGWGEQEEKMLKSCSSQKESPLAGSYREGELCVLGFTSLEQNLHLKIWERSGREQS